MKNARVPLALGGFIATGLAVALYPATPISQAPISPLAMSATRVADLVRGDTATNVIMMGDHDEGMAFLKGVAIDQHLLQRNRHFDLIEVIRARPDLLGIGLDENTAIIVKGDSFEVIGQSYAAIYDHQRMLDSGGLFYFLAPGDTYDLATRQFTRPGAMANPGGRLVPR